jgi:hypothetical protein
MGCPCNQFSETSRLTIYPGHSQMLEHLVRFVGDFLGTGKIQSTIANPITINNHISQHFQNLFFA